MCEGLFNSFIYNHDLINKVSVHLFDWLLNKHFVVRVFAFKL